MPFFLVIYVLIMFFNLIGTGIEYLLIGMAILLAVSIIGKTLHFTFSTLFGKVGEVIISIILAIPALLIACSIVGVIAVIIIALLAFPFVFIVGALGVSWITLFSVIAGFIGVICLLSWYYSKNEKPNS